MSAKFSEFCFKKLLDYVESLVDQDDMKLMTKVSQRIEKLLETDLEAAFPVKGIDT